MTYREIAAARGIKPEAAVRLVQRRKWPKQERSNDGLAHVLVPPDWIRIRPADGATPPDVAPRHHPPSSPPDFAGAIQGAIDALREAKDGEITALRERRPLMRQGEPRLANALIQLRPITDCLVD